MQVRRSKDGLEYCRRCASRRAPTESCASCGRVTRVNARQPDGSGLCAACYAKERQAVALATRAGNWPRSSRERAVVAVMTGTCADVATATRTGSAVYAVAPDGSLFVQRRPLLTCARPATGPRLCCARRAGRRGWGAGPPTMETRGASPVRRPRGSTSSWRTSKGACAGVRARARGTAGDGPSFGAAQLGTS